jgi:vitamin B12 transporter
MSSRTCHALAAALIATASPGLQAEERGDNIETIVVTATRTPIAVREALVPVTVIDRAQIERSSARDLSEVLRFQAGIDVVRSGGPGQQTSLFTRGTSSDQTLVLIDGVRMNSGSVGIAAVEHIAPEMIDRVEIVRGPRTSLYGEDAVGGVINVITRRPSGGELEMAAGYGADDTRQASLSGGARWRDVDAGLTLTSLTTDGFPAVEAGTSDQGYDNLTLNAFAATELGRVRTEARFWQSDGTTDYLTQDCSAFPLPCSDFAVDQDYLNRTMALRASLRPVDRWETALDVSTASDDIDQNQSPDFAHTDRLVLDWQNTVSVADGHVAVAGLYFADEDVEAVSFGSPLVTDDTTVAAVYAEDNVSAGPHQLGLAARYSDHDAYGAKLTWNTEYGYALWPGLRLIGTAGRALRAPNASERYSSFGGNPDLAPEDSTTFSAGLQWDAASGHRLGITVYRIRIDELINYALVEVPGSDFPIFQLQNIDEAQISGVEASWDYSADQWQWRLAGTVQDPEDEATGATLARRAKQSFTASLARNFGPHQLGLDALMVGPREDFPADAGLPGTLAGYGLINLNGLYSAHERLKLRVRVENLLDRDYAPAFYDFSRRYTAPGRGLYAELRYDLR